MTSGSTSPKYPLIPLAGFSPGLFSLLSGMDLNDAHRPLINEGWFEGSISILSPIFDTNE